VAELVVRYFAGAEEAAGIAEERMTPLDTVGDLKSALIERYGEPMARVVAGGSFLVDGVVSRDDATRLGTAVDVLPPFAGG